MVDRKTGDRSKDIDVSGIRGDENAIGGTSRFKGLKGRTKALAEGAWHAGYAAGYLDATAGPRARPLVVTFGGRQIIASGEILSTYSPLHTAGYLYRL